MTPWLQRHGATALLVLMAVIFLVTYPLHRDPFWGLITHISGAAMIGGLADWYAVTALFTKPLGIPFKTALIPKNKERFVEMARHMMVDELLRVSHMYEVLKQERVPQRIVSFMNSATGRGYVHVCFEELKDHVLPHVKENLLQEQLLGHIKNGVESWRVTPFVVSLCRQLLEPERAEVLWMHINRMFQRLLAAEGIRPYLLGLVSSVMNRYADHSFLRELALALGGESLSPEYITHMIQVKGCAYLMSQESLQSPLGTAVYTKARWAVDELAQNGQWQRKLEDKKNAWFREFIEDGYVLEDTLDLARYIEQGEAELYHFFERLETNAVKGRKAERFILFQLLHVLNYVRPWIEHIVVREMNRFTPEEITRILQSKLGYDLQMIRINGSLVGAILGGLFYGLTLLKGGIL